MKPAALPPQGHTLAPDVLLVPEHVARNPLARAVAKARMVQAGRDFAIRLLMLTDGEDAQIDALAAARTIYMACVLAEARGASASPDCRVMHGAISTLQALAQRRWAWRIVDAPAIDAGLTRALAEIAAASAKAAQAAWLVVDSHERHAASSLPWQPGTQPGTQPVTQPAPALQATA